MPCGPPPSPALEALFSAVGRLTQRAAAQGNEIALEVVRGDGERVALRLRPRPWEGAGVLGCHLVPVEE